MYKLLVKLVVGTETVFFITLIVTYLYFSHTPTYHMDARNLLDIKTTGVFSLFLFTSSFTLMLAERNQKRGELKKLQVWLLITIICGLVFLFGQGSEYQRLLKSGFSISKNVFSTSFFTLTSFHGMHVLIGVFILSVILGGFSKNKMDVSHSNHLSTISIYWHFVDLVWLVVFSVVYFIPYLN